MRGMFNFYLLLGVPSNASKEEIVKRHKELSLIYHPDRAGENYTDLLKEINHAKDVLLDPSKRYIHDNHLKNNFGQSKESNEDNVVILRLAKQLKESEQRNLTLNNELKLTKKEIEKLTMINKELLDRVSKTDSCLKRMNIKIGNNWGCAALFGTGVTFTYSVYSLLIQNFEGFIVFILITILLIAFSNHQAKKP